jgi:hypothetical protein
MTYTDCISAGLWNGLRAGGSCGTPCNDNSLLQQGFKDGRLCVERYLTAVTEQGVLFRPVITKKEKED